MTAVLIDTSVWIEFFRSKGNPAIKSRVADYLSLGHAAYCCPVRFELYLGARSEERRDLEEGLGFARRLTLGPHHWDRAADPASSMRKQGRTVPISDILIAIVAAEAGIPLMSLDDHFQVIRDTCMKQLRLIDFQSN